MDFGTSTVLITGANGWLGKSLVDCLLNGIKNSADIDKPDKKLIIKCLVLKGGYLITTAEIKKNYFYRGRYNQN